MPKAIREVYGTVLAELGDTNENIVVLDADLSGSTKSAMFGKAHPERFFNMGIAEQNMVATAAGMSTVGKIPFVNTFTVFLTSLGLLSARDQICYANLNVKFGGAYCGMSDALDGASHHATEDMAIMRALPNMKVIVPSDATSTRWATKYAVENYGPMYLRLSRDVYPDLYAEDAQFELGKGAIVCAEEHNIYGGLGGAVSEVLAWAGAGVPTEFVGIQDTFTESGPYKELLAKYGVDANGVIAGIEKVLARK